MVVIAAIVLMVAATAVAGWAWHNSESEREELSAALEDLRVALGKPFLPPLRMLERLLARLNTRLSR